MKLPVKWFPSRMSFYPLIQQELTGSELKKRTKERERTAQKAAKAAAAPPVAQKKTSAAAAEDELDPSVSYTSSSF
jgi:lysyl-tRNA synthetase class 2